MRNSFTDTFVKNLDQAGRYTDGSTTGLNLQVKQGGGKYWTYRYLFQGKRCDFSLGSYPSVSNHLKTDNRPLEPKRRE